MNNRTTEHARGVQRSSRIAGLRSCIAGAAIALAIASPSFGEDPAANLLPPQTTLPRSSIRASGDGLILPETPEQSAKPTSRDPDFKYPETYSTTHKSGDFPVISSLWTKIAGGPASRNGDQKVVLNAQAPVKAVAAGHGAGHGEPVGIAPLPVRPPAPLPAWRWYGYGAPVPGMNPLAPSGVYSTVNPNWYPQSGATPGAIPLTHDAVLPFPTDAEPPLAARRSRNVPPVTPISEQATNMDLLLPEEHIRPANLQMPAIEVPGKVESINPDGRPAILEAPIRPVKAGESDGQFTSSLPASARSNTPLWRGQAPNLSALPPAICSALRTTCSGYVSRIEIQPRDPGKIGLRLRLLKDARADLLANRIASIPCLKDYEIEMSFIP